MTVNDALGSNAAGTVIASGATLDLQNVNYTTTEAITNNGGTLATSTGTSAYAGVMTLGADSTVDVDGTQLTISTAIGDGSGGYAITKDGNGTLVLSATSTYTGDTTISNGTLTVTGTLADTTDVSVASGATYDVDQTDTIQSLSGAGTINIASTNILTFGDANDKTIDGVIEGDGSIVKVGSSTYTLSGTNTYTGQTNINTGTLAVTVNDALGSNAAGTVIASGATLDLQNVNYTTTEAITNNGGTLATSTGTSAYAGVMTLGADSTVDVDGTQLTISTAIGDGSGGYAITKDGNGTLVLSATSTYTGDTTISAGTLKLTGNLDSATDLVIAPSATLDLQAALTAATLDLDGTISNTAGTSSLIISGTSSLGGSITTTGTQTYNNAVTLTGDTTLATSSAQVTFAANATINSEGSETNNLTITASETELNGVIGYTRTLGVIDINGNLDLNAAITNATSMDVSGTANLGADVTTSGNQTYSGAVILSTNVSLSGGNQLLFGGTVNSSDTDSTSDARTLTTTFTETELDGIVGGTYALGAMDINGALDLDAAISGAASMDVSGTANLGADVTTTGTQTYQDAVTLSADVTLTTTDSNVVFGSTVNSSATTGAPSVTLQDTNHGWSSLTVSGTAGEETSFDINYPGFGNDRYDTVILGANSTIKLYANGGFEPLITTITNNTNSAVTNNFGDVGLSSFKLSGSGSSSSNNRTLTINTGGNTDVIQFSGTIGDSASLGAISITGVLDLDAAITSAASLSVSGTANLGADVTTSGNQTYSGAVILSTNVSLSGGNQLLFGGTVNSSDTDSTSDARTLTTTFTETELDGIVGGTYALGAMDITGTPRFRCQHCRCRLPGRLRHFQPRCRCDYHRYTKPIAGRSL